MYKVVILCFLILCIVGCIVGDSHQSDKKELKENIHELTSVFERERAEAEEELENVYLDSIKRKVKAIAAESDYKWTESLLDVTNRIMETMKLVSTLDEKQLSLDHLIGKIPERPAKDCSQLMAMDNDPKSGVYWLQHPVTKRIFRVACDLENLGGSWMLFGLKTNGAKFESLHSFSQDYNRDRLGRRGYFDMENQISTINIDKFDNIYGVSFDVLIKIGPSFHDVSDYILLSSSKQSVTKPSDMSQHILHPWTIPEGNNCVVIPEVGRACRVSSKLNQEPSTDHELNPLSSEHTVSFWIRK